MALEVILNGLVIEQAYDPANISQNQVELLLAQLFEILVPHPMLGAKESSNEKEELSSRKRSRNSVRACVSAYGTGPKPL